jgi:7-cyano-7-deazaguanine synthase
VVKCVAVVSGGMDSVTLAYLLKGQGHEVHAISFDYGQRHKKELWFARQLVQDKVVTSHETVDLSGINMLVQGSALTSPDIEVPEGHYAADNMKLTVVPNRNMIMLAIAGGYAVSLEASFVATGVHAGDHAVYPDCRPQFVQAMERALRVANEGFGKFPGPVDFTMRQPDTFAGRATYAPFIFKGKHDIVRIGSGLSVPYEKTWSCYKGGDYHCGRCGTCVERKEAFRLARVKDPTRYDDASFEIEAYV